VGLLAPLVINGNMKITCEEWHAFVIGFGDAVWFWRKLPMPLKYDNPLEEEYHYYVGGGVTAIFMVVGIIIGVIIYILGG